MPHTDTPQPTPLASRRHRLRRRVRKLRTRLHESRRRTRVATAAAVLATAVAVVLAFWPDPKPDPILLGRGPAGVATVSSPPQPSGETPTPSEETAPTGSDLGSGDASYYGTELEGNPTASGEAFRSEGLTAAHRSLPLGSRIRVTNLRNDESVVVRVNDRGPFAKDRVVDLSKAAAREIGMLQSGTARVRMELLPGSLPTRG